jgi:CRISPR/Cas system CSM-associated protein Csm3 (group 7 of RAMP superfamily)
MGNGRLSGVLRVTLTARTPLLIGGFESTGYAGEKTPDVPRRGDGTPMVPGSGLLGAVRSVHEALAGGCLRVLDTDWVAVHRHPASTSETAGLRLAVVLDADGKGRASSVGLCDQVVWIDQEILPRDDGRVPQTGDRLRAPAAKAADSGNRKVLRAEDIETGEVAWAAAMSAGLDESWVLLVTDTKARTPGKPVYFAAGRVGRDTPRCEIPDTTWATYRRLVDGADDLRPARLPGRKEPEFGSCLPEYEDVFWPPPADGNPAGPVIARRLVARHYLHPGQPVWVRAEDRVVTEIRLAQLWRYPGGYPVGDRAGNAAPCTDPERLCWSCRVFGSADTSGRRDDDTARQRSYRGHVRADDLLAATDFEPVAWHLAPLAAPRPSAGQFYLDNTAVPARKQRAAKDTRPAATWGSCADTGRPRPIRGRKFYWRTADPQEGAHSRGSHRHQSDTQSRHALLVPAGTVFTGRVCFENLSAQDYGSLLAALDPRLLDAAGAGDWLAAVTSVGGGKPFGFGAVSIDVTAESVHTAAGRYLGREQDVPGVAEAVSAFRGTVPRPVAATWAALRNALTLGFIPDDQVWYPPGAKGAKGDADFDRSFEFFSRTTGLTLKDKDKVRDLVVLPPADAASEAQKLDSMAGEHATGDGERAPGRGDRRMGEQERPARRRRP